MIKFLWKKPSKPRKIALRKEGAHYNLQEVFDQVNQEYFNSEVDLNITWSSRPITGARRYRRLGCFSPRQKLVRISPILDDPLVPSYFLSFIVYHEILHHIYPPYRAKGRWQIHHLSFRQQERKFVEYSKAKKWMKEIGRKTFFQG